MDTWTKQRTESVDSSKASNEEAEGNKEEWAGDSAVDAMSDCAAMNGCKTYKA